MNIKDQVVSLDLAKRLKELSIPQESYFYWIDGKLENRLHIFARPEDREVYSAFTNSELGELLPKTDITIEYAGGEWEVNYTYKGISQTFYCNNEANARAKLLIFLTENNLLKP